MLHHMQQRNGDAISETTGWHGSGNSTWMSNWEGESGVVRATSGSIYSFYARARTNSASGDAGNINQSYRSRAVIVQGEDI